MATLDEEAAWAAPAPLLGVKSRRKPIFAVESARLSVGDGVSRVSMLRVALESRIVAVGAAGLSAVQLLLEERSLIAGRPKSHDDLKVVRLGPDAAVAIGDACATVASAAAASVAKALEARPQIVVLQEAGDAAWGRVFHHILASEEIRAFRGAVVVCVDQEIPEVRLLCKERWAGADGWLWQESIEGDSLELWEDVLGKGCPPGVENLDEVLAEVSACPEFRGDSVAVARALDWELSILMDRATDTLCGFICHTPPPGPGKTELHVLRLAVPLIQQKSGHGHRMLMWILRKAARMPKSECAWIGVSALDTAVPFYEKFGLHDVRRYR